MANWTLMGRLLRSVQELRAEQPTGNHKILILINNFVGIFRVEISTHDGEEVLKAKANPEEAEQEEAELKGKSRVSGDES